MSEEGVTSPAVPEPPSLIDDIPAEPASAAEGKKAEPEGEKTPEPETTEQQEEKKRSRFQRRLDAQKSARIAAETETRMLREQNARLEAQLKIPQQEAGAPSRDQFEDYESYLSAITKHEAKQAAREELKSERDANQGRERQEKQSADDARISQEWVKREQDFQAETRDYLEVVTPYVDVEIGNLSDGARRIILEAGPQLLYHLASNPDVGDRIAGLSPIRQIAELGKLEDVINKPAVRKASNAPAPIKPVGQARTHAGGYHEGMSQEEFEAWRSPKAKWGRRM